MKTAWCALLLVVGVSGRAEISRLHRIDDHLYSGKQPKAADFAELAQMGIRTVLDFRGGPIHKPRERKRVEAAGMQYVSIRLSGIFPPKEWQIEKILALLEDPARAPVFIHCWRGDDRVGLVIACYRMVHYHWTNRQALEEARHNGLNVLEVLMQRYIRRFDASQVRRTAGQAALVTGPAR